MDSLEQKVNNLQIEVSALKEKVSFFSVIYDKFDATLDKVQTMIEDRRQDTNNDLKEVYNKMDDVENKIMKEIGKLREEMMDHHKEEKRKLADIDKWRWIVMGASIVLGWMSSKIAIQFPLFK